MPYVRRFYYLPRDNAPKDTDVLAPCEILWKFEGTSLRSDNDECKASSARPKSFQDLPNDEQIKQLRYKKILGMLNKMTPKKFQKLILQIGPESMDITYVKMLAEIIFSKALVDEMYVNLYAKLCEEVTSTLPTESLDCFKKVLIDLCETGFNQLLDLTDNDIGCINEDKRYTFKRRLMTLMRFIGEMSCISVAFFNRIYNWRLTEQLIDKGDELHLEAVYFLLFTISLRSTDNAWTKRIESAVGQIAHGCKPNGGGIRSEIKFKFMALSDLRRGCLLQSYCSDWNLATDQDLIFNFHFISGLFPECSNKSSEQIVEILMKSTDFSNIKLWKVTDRINSDSFAQIIFAIDNQSYAWLNNCNFSLPFQSFSISFKQFDSYIPLNSSSISQDSNSSEIEDSGSESDYDDQGDGDSSDSNSNGTTYGSAVGDSDMLEVLSKFGLTVKNGCVEKVVLSESDETEDSSDIEESSSDNEVILDENSTIEKKNDSKFDDNLKSYSLVKSHVQINPAKAIEVKQNFTTQNKTIKTEEAAEKTDVTAKRTNKAKEIKKLPEESDLSAKTDKPVIGTDDANSLGKNVLNEPGSSRKSIMGFLNQFDEMIELKQNVKKRPRSFILCETKNESSKPDGTRQCISVKHSIATENLAIATPANTSRSDLSIPTKTLETVSSSNDCRIDKSSSFSSSKKIENSLKEKSAPSLISCFSNSDNNKSFCTQVKGKKIVLPKIRPQNFAFFGNFTGLFRLQNSKFLSLLDEGNKNAQIAKWKLVDRACISDNEAQITFIAPRCIIKDLKRINYKVIFKSNVVLLNPIDFQWDEDIKKEETSVPDSSKFGDFEISITPLNFPNDLFSDETLKSLENHVLTKKEEYNNNQQSYSNNLEPELNFEAICVMKGWLLVLCSNRETLNWILFLHFGSTYVLKHVGINISRIDISGYFPFNIDDQLLEEISKENDWVKDWSIINKEKTSIGALITFSIDAKSAHQLLINKNMINLTRDNPYKVELVWKNLIRVVTSPQTRMEKISPSNISIKNDKVLFEGEFIYSSRYNTRSIVESLVQCNKTVDFTSWDVFKRTDLNDGSIRLIFSAKRESLKCLDKIKYNLFFNCQVIPLNLLNNQKWKEVLNLEDEGSTSSKKIIVQQPGLKDKIDQKSGLKDKSHPQPGLKDKIDQKPGLMDKIVQQPSLKDKTNPQPGLKDKIDKKPGLKDKIVQQPGLKDKSHPQPGLKDKIDQKPGLKDNTNPQPGLKDKSHPQPGLKDKIDQKPGLKDNTNPQPGLKDKIDQKPGLNDKTDQQQGFKYKIDEKLFKKSEVKYSDYKPTKVNDRVTFQAKFPKSVKYNTKNILEILSQCNKNVDLSSWSSVARDDLNDHVRLTLCADKDAMKCLTQFDFSLFYNNEKIKLSPISDKSWNDELEFEVIHSANISMRGNESNDIIFEGVFPKIKAFLKGNVLEKLIKSNQKLGLEKWKIIDKDCQTVNVYILFSADIDSLQMLKKAKYKIKYGNFYIKFHPADSSGWDEAFANCISTQNVTRATSHNNKDSTANKNLHVSKESSISNVSRASTVSNNVSKLGPAVKNVSSKSKSVNVISQSKTGNQLNEPQDATKNSNLPDVVQNAKPLVFLFAGEFPLSSHLKSKMINSILLALNPKLNSNDWKVLLRQDKNFSAVLTFSADYKLLKPLKEANFKLSYNKMDVHVKPVNNISWDEIVNIFDIQQYNECVKSQIESILTNENASLVHIESLKASLLQSEKVKESELQSSNNININENPLKSCNKNISQEQNGNLLLKDQRKSSSKNQNEFQNKADETKLALFQVIFPDSCDMKNKELYDCVLNCNRKLGVTKWKIVERQNIKKSARFIFKANYNCLLLLKDYRYRISYQKNQLLVKSMNRTWDEWEQMLKPPVENKTDSVSVSNSSTDFNKVQSDSYNRGPAYPIQPDDSHSSLSVSALNYECHHSTTYPIASNELFLSRSIDSKSSLNNPLPTNNNSSNFPIPSACSISPYRRMNNSVPSSSNFVLTQKNVDSKQQSFSNTSANLTGFKVAILPANFPSILFTEEQFKRIERVINDYIYYEKVSNKLEFIPKLNAIKKFGGWMLVLCHDKLTADWLVNLELEPWVKAKLTVVKED